MHFIITSFDEMAVVFVLSILGALAFIITFFAQDMVNLRHTSIANLSKIVCSFVLMISSSIHTNQLSGLFFAFEIITVLVSGIFMLNESMKTEDNKEESKCNLHFDNSSLIAQI